MEMGVVIQYLPMIIVVAFFSVLFLLALLLFFGKLMLSQFKAKMLARRGYYQVEHIGSDKLRRFFFLRPKDDHYDIDDGFYMFMKDATTRSSTEVLAKVPADLLKADGVVNPNNQYLANLSPRKKRLYLDRLMAEEGELKKISEVISNLKFSFDAVSYRFGIPTITYYSDDPIPVHFGRDDKLYSAKTLKQLYLRVLLTQKWNELNKIVRLGVIALGVIAIAAVFYIIVMNNQTHNLATCEGLLNQTSQRLYDTMQKCAGNLTRTVINI